MNELIRASQDPVSPYLAAPRASAETVGGPSTLDLGRLLSVLRERWLLIVACAAGGILVGLLLFATAVPLYRASAVLEGNPPKVEVMSPDKRDFEAQDNSYDFLATQVGLMKSRAVAERAAQNLKLGADADFSGTAGTLAERTDGAADRIQAGLQVEVPETGQIITLTYTGTSPQRTAQIANAIADAFIETHIERRFEASDHARKFLDQQIIKTRAALEKSERALVAYQQAQGIINTTTAEGQSADVASLQGASLISLNEALATATSQRVQAQAAYEQGRLAVQSDAAESSSALRGTLANLEAEYQDKRTLLKPDHPEMISLQSRIAELRKQIAQTQSLAAGSKTAGLLAAYRAAAATESRLSGQVAALKGAVLGQRGNSIQYNILQRDVDTNRSLYDALLQRFKEVGVGSEIGDSPVSIVDRAQAPKGPFSPDLRKNLLLGLIAGLIAGLAAAFAQEFLNDTIKTREDVRKKLDRACLGVIPKEKDNDTLLEDFRDPGSAVSEAYSAVVAALRFSSDEGAPKVLAITSANPSEGKSSSALAVATNYARRGERVLLIDADLRRPVFKGNSNERGLTNLLASREPLTDHVVKTEIDNLWLLPCGAIAPNPADLLSMGRMGDVLAEAGKAFDHVVVDGPPVLGMADASFIGAAARTVMIVVESGRSRTRAVREAIDRIEGSGARLVGVTITKSTEEASRYGYGSYRYYKKVDGGDHKTIMIVQQEDA